MVKHIKIEYIPSCTWEFEGGMFFCLHDEDMEIVDYVEDHLGISGHYQTESKGYVCADCGEQLEGDPEADRADYEAECQLMELLDK